MRPGMMQLARMLSGAWSRARARVSPTTADLLTVYCADDLPGLGRRAVTDETLMMEPLPAFFMCGYGVAAHVDHAHEVYGGAAIPVFVGGLDDAAATASSADVVVQDVDSAVALDSGGNHVLAVVGVGYVGGGSGCLAAFFGDDAGGRLCPLAYGVNEYDLRAFPGEEYCGCRAVADAASAECACTADDGDLAAESHCILHY